MDILICFHTLADLELLSDDDWTEGSRSAFVDTSYLKKAINSYDESALELACRFAEQIHSKKKKCTLTALTVGGRENDAFLDTLIAIGFDHAVRLCTADEDPAGALSPEKICCALDAWISSHGGYDVIIAGQQSGDGNNGKVPLLLAERMNTTCITCAKELIPVADDFIRVVWTRDDAICTADIKTPAVITIGNTAETYLRVPTLRQRLASRNLSREIYSLGDYLSSYDSSSKSEPEYLKAEPVIEKRNTVFIGDKNADEAAEIMAEYCRKWRRK